MTVHSFVDGAVCHDIPTRVVRHSIVCAVPAKTVFDAILDVETATRDLDFVDVHVVHRCATHASLDFTAKVGDDERSWRSERTIHHDLLAVDACIDPPIPPCRSMTTHWRVLPRGPRTAEIVVEHRLQLSGNTEQVESFLSGLDSNATRELAQIREHVETGSNGMRPARVPVELVEAIGNFLPRLMFLEARYAPTVTWGDVSIALADFDPLLRTHPHTEPFWREWLRVWSARADVHAAHAVSSGGATARRAHRSAAACYHWAQFLYFDDVEVKRSLKGKTRSHFLLSLPPTSGIEKHTITVRRKDVDVEVPCLIAFPEGDAPSPEGHPWIMFSNGLDSSTEVEPLSIGERFLDRGIAVVLPELPGLGVQTGVNGFSSDVVRLLDQLFVALTLDPRLSRQDRAFGGISFGGQVALNVAANTDTALSCVVNLSGGPAPTSVQDLPRRLVADFTCVFGTHTVAELARRLDALAVHRESTPRCPVLSVHGALDDIYPVAVLEDLDEGWGEMHELWVLQDEAHVCLNSIAELAEDTADWVARRLNIYRDIPRPRAVEAQAARNAS